MKRFEFLLFTLVLVFSGCVKEPFSDFIVSETLVTPGEVIYFTNRSSDALRYEWDFGDGYSSTNFNVSHSYENPGSYTVKLSALGKNNKINVSSIIIEVIRTDLEITVLEWNDEYPVANASVILYLSIDDWINETNPVIEGFTNQNGKVLFTNLIHNKTYYVDVWEANHDNYALAAEDSYWITTEQLIFGKRNQFIAWVDYYESGKKNSFNRKDLKSYIFNSFKPEKVRSKDSKPN